MTTITQNQKRNYWLFALLAVVSLGLAGCGIAKEKRITDEDLEQESTEAPEGSAKVISGSELKALDPGSYVQTWRMEDGRPVSFSIFIPELYNPGEKTPLVLSLHYGAEKMPQFFGNKMMRFMTVPATKNLNAIVVAPDIQNLSWTNFRCEECVMALMHEVCSQYNIDRSRVLVLGYSLGAEGAWHLAGKHPDFFTAALPMAGKPPVDFLSTRWTVPMLVIHSTSDEVYPFEEVQAAATQLEQRGDEVQLMPLKGISHFDSAKFVEPLQKAADWVQQVWDSQDPAN